MHAGKAVVVAVAVAAAPALAQPPDGTSDAARLRSLDARLAALERARRDQTAVVRFGHEGFALQIPDGTVRLRIHGYVQADGRAYFDDDAHALPDTFLPRRVRPILDASFFGWLDARIMPDFGAGKAVLQEAYVDLRPFDWLRLRAGKDKVPVGLERLQSARAIRLPERALPTDLVPNRDVGAQLHGRVADGLVDWALGVLNGTVDGADAPDVAVHDGKDGAARLFFRPLRPLGVAALAELGLGLAGTFGEARGTPALPSLPSYKSAGQATFFSYRDDVLAPGGATLADGDRWHVAPQLYYAGGPVGVLAEYVLSAQDVVRGDRRATIRAQAWQIQLSLLLTPGDRETYDVVTPQRPLAHRRRGCGAFELVARYDELRVSAAAFPTFADPSRSARRARDFGVAVNWWANPFFRAAVSFDRTDYAGGAPRGARAPENVLIGRLQAVF